MTLGHKWTNVSLDPIISLFPLNRSKLIQSLSSHHIGNIFCTKYFLQITAFIIYHCSFSCSVCTTNGAPLPHKFLSIYTGCISFLQNFLFIYDGTVLHTLVNHLMQSASVTINISTTKFDF